MEMAKVDCSGLVSFESVGIRGGGTGMYVEIRDARDCFCTECSGRGPSGVCIETAKPLKQGMLAVPASPAVGGISGRKCVLQQMSWLMKVERV